MNNTAGGKIQSIALATLLIGGVFYAGFYAGAHFKTDIEKVTTLEGKEIPPELQAKVDFSPFWSVWNVLNEKFVSSATSTSDQTRVWGAIAGLAASLDDPYTVFLTPEDTKLFESEISGNFEGIGMEIGIKDDMLTVIAPLKGTPAERAGIRPGDKILKINDEASASMRVEQAVKLIRGKKGSEVRLTLIREGKKEPFEVKVVRDTIAIPTLDTEIKKGAVAASGQSGAENALQNGVFVIRLYNFSANAPRMFRDALRDFVESGSNKLVLDLRGNPGGFLEAGVDIASWFLPAGKVVVVEDFGKGKERRAHRSRGYDVFNENLKMAILVNSGTASASEILAGALQAHGKAKLIGTKTFGKGSVQELVKIVPDASLKVTVARWLTPNDISLSNGGLTPDIEVKLTPEDAEKGRDPQLDKAIELLTQ